MNLLRDPRFLGAYAGVVTVAFVVVLTTGAAAPARSARFDVIDVQRINVREPDGLLRMTISNNARFPGGMFHGRELPHEGRREGQTAGMLFLDGEGSESGGLTFGGIKGADGTIRRFGHLSFDQYDQDQIVALQGGRDERGKFANLSFNDAGDWPISEAIELDQRTKSLTAEERQKAFEEFNRSHSPLTRRAYLGRSSDSSARLDLNDAQGKPRLRLRVSAEGEARIEFLDADGKVVERWPPAAKS